MESSPASSPPGSPEKDEEAIKDPGPSGGTQPAAEPPPTKPSAAGGLKDIFVKIFGSCLVVFKWKPNEISRRRDRFVAHSFWFLFLFVFWSACVLRWIGDLDLRSGPQVKSELSNAATPFPVAALCAGSGSTLKIFGADCTMSTKPGSKGTKCNMQYWNPKGLMSTAQPGFDGNCDDCPLVPSDHGPTPAPDCVMSCKSDVNAEHGGTRWLTTYGVPDFGINVGSNMGFVGLGIMQNQLGKPHADCTATDNFCQPKDNTELVPELVSYPAPEPAPDTGTRAKRPCTDDTSCADAFALEGLTCSDTVYDVAMSDNCPQTCNTCGLDLGTLPHAELATDLRARTAVGGAQGQCILFNTDPSAKGMLTFDNKRGSKEIVGKIYAQKVYAPWYGGVGEQHVSEDDPDGQRVDSSGLSLYIFTDNPACPGCNQPDANGQPPVGYIQPGSRYMASFEKVNYQSLRCMPEGMLKDPTFCLEVICFAPAGATELEKEALRLVKNYDECCQYPSQLRNACPDINDDNKDARQQVSSWKLSTTGSEKSELRFAR